MYIVYYAFWGCKGSLFGASLEADLKELAYMYCEELEQTIDSLVWVKIWDVQALKWEFVKEIRK